MNGTSRVTADVFPSIVLPLQNAANYIDSYLERLDQVLQQNFQYYEIILVNNGSVDDSLTHIQRLQHRIPNISLYNLAHHYSISIATIAGLDHAIGDYVVILDPRQDPPELVLPMVEKALGEVDVVYAVTNDRAAARSFYYKAENLFLSYLGRLNRTNLPPVLSSARLFSRQALNFILKAVDRHRILSVAPALSGYSTAEIHYQPEPQVANEPTLLRWMYSFYRAAELTLSLSTKPLRFVALLSLFICFLTVLYSIYVVAYWLTNDTASGWASLSLQISGLFFLVSLVLALISEYMQQILENIGRRPLYFYTTHTQSDQMSIAQDLNVIEEQDTTLPPTASEQPNPQEHNQ